MTPHNSLAGRRARFVPGVEALEERLVPAVNFIVQGSTLFIMGPTTRRAGGQHIVITDNGGSGPNNVTAFSKQPFSPNVPIRTVVVNTTGGDDRVAYNLIGDLSTPRTLNLNLGGGSDRFVATIRRNLLTGSSLSITANGGGGPDNLQAVLIGSLGASSQLALNYDGGRSDNIIRISSASVVNVGPGASLTENLIGNGGSDRIVTQYQGVLAGNLQINAHGGHGPNTMNADIEVAAGSSGRILPSSLIGGPRDDTLTFLVHNSSGIPANNQFLDGDGGFNTAVRTSNVIVSHVARDRVVP
jgi:hypothetical protein